MKYFRLYPDSWFAGTLPLDIAETGAFANLCFHYYSKDGLVSDDPQTIARITKVSVRRWNTIRQTLIDGAFISIEAGRIKIDRCDHEIKRALERSEVQRSKAEKRWRAHAGRKETPRKRAENSSKISRAVSKTDTKNDGFNGANTLENSDTADATALPMHDATAMPEGMPTSTPLTLLRKGESPEAEKERGRQGNGANGTETLKAITSTVPPTATKSLFDTALPLLADMADKTAMSRARSRIGKWRKELAYDDAALYQIVVNATAKRDRNDLADAESWIAGCVNKLKAERSKAPGARPGAVNVTSPEWKQEQAERRRAARAE